jgi:hypothetical protein
VHVVHGLLESLLVVCHDYYCFVAGCRQRQRKQGITQGRLTLLQHHTITQIQITDSPGYLISNTYR